MTYYRLTIDAEEDLHRIWRYGLLHYGEQRAGEYYLHLIPHFKHISENPYLSLD